jgi:hypothetical protein
LRYNLKKRKGGAWENGNIGKKRNQDRDGALEKTEGNLERRKKRKK